MLSQSPLASTRCPSRMMVAMLAITSALLGVVAGDSSVTTPEQREAFRRDGYVILSGLLDKEELHNLVYSGALIHKHNKGPNMNPFFDSVEKGVIVDGPAVAMDSEARRNVTESFRHVTLHSRVPQAAAELMGLNENHNLRVLRDVFLGKGLTPRAAGWHVDDPSFWPESFQSTGGDGVNAWIAMVDLPYGGGLAVAPGSHRAHWRHRAYKLLGQDHNVTGYSKQQVFDMLRNNRNTSFSIDDDPILLDTIERDAVYPELKRGDVVFHTRWLFHKTSDLSPKSVEFYQKEGVDALDRYSIRYVPGKATLPTGFLNELSVLSNPDNAGRTLDEVAELDDLWYPRVWPSVERDCATRLSALATTKVPHAKAVAQAMTAELISIIRGTPPPSQEDVPTATPIRS